MSKPPLGSKEWKDMTDLVRAQRRAEKERDAARVEADKLRGVVEGVRAWMEEWDRAVLDSGEPHPSTHPCLPLVKLRQLDADPPEVVRGEVNNADPLYLGIQPFSVHNFKPHDPVLIMRRKETP